MKKLLTFLGIFSVLLTLAGCVKSGDETYEPPKFVGLSIDGQNPNNGTELVTFYKEKNESTLVEVVLTNPDKLEIRNIYINGYSYGYARFNEGSTHDTIYFNLDPGDDLGELEYSVDDIEYFDGSDTKDEVVTESNNKFNVYVFKDIPTVVRDNYLLSQNSIRIDFDITDTDAVIDGNELIVELFSGDSLVSSKEVSPGFVTVSFDSLLSDKLYEIKVRADYNIDDNTGDHEEVVLFNGTFTTLPTSLPSAILSNIEIGSDMIEFDVTYNDEDNVTKAGALRVALYEGGIFVRDITLTGSQTNVVFDNLFNTTDYTIKIISDYNLRDGQGLQTEYIITAANLTTLSRAVPIPLINNVVVEENRILFSITIDDDPISPIIDISTLVAKVYIGGNLERTVQISGSVVDIQIYDVLAGNEVFIELVASYDLNDGNGVQTDQIIHTIQYESLLNSPPVIVIEDVVVTQGYVNVGLLITDNNNTLTSAISAVLYENEIEVDRVNINFETTDFLFNYLVEYTKNYRVELIADYNLRDGSGEKEAAALYAHELTSLVPKAPASEVQNTITTTTGFSFDVLVMDADNTVVANSLFVYIYKDGVLVDTQSISVGLNNMSFDGTFTGGGVILSDNGYEIFVKADYNVFDGSGIQTDEELVEAQILTKPKALPSAFITNEESTIDEVSLNIFVTDTDDVVEPGSLVAVLYQNGMIIGAPEPLIVGDNFAVTFEDIMSFTQYEIKILVDYDLDNSEGIIPEFELGKTEIETEPKDFPEATIDNISTGKEEITFDVIVTDTHTVITPNTTKAVLYVGNVATGHEVVLSTGLNPGVTFTNVYSHQEFNIRIVTDYDLNDGVNVATEAQLTYDFAETGINGMVTGDIYSVVGGIDTLTFSAIISDYDLVSTTNLKAILLLDNIATGAEIPLSIGDNPGLLFDNLISDSEYTIRIETDYNKRDIIGEITEKLLDSYTINTDDYSAPNGYINNVITDIESITFNSIVTDVDDTSTGVYKAVLFLDDSATGAEHIIGEGITNLLEFSGLLSGREYEVRVLATYDLHDGNGDQTDQLMSASFIETLARKVPVGNASGMTVSDSSVRFLFDFTDEDNTLVPGTFAAWLYDRNNDLVSSKTLYADEVTFDISNMPADYEFTVCISASYNLLDGADVVQGNILCLNGEEDGAITRANEVPGVGVSSITINQETVDATFNVSDGYGVINGDVKAQLYDSSHALIDEVSLVLGIQTASFTTTLNSGELYNIIVVASYNLRDANGNVVDAVISENTIMSFNDLIPQAHIFDVQKTVNSMTFDVIIIDHDTTYVGNAKAILFKDGVAVDEVGLIIGLNDDKPFTGLVSDSDYEIRIVIDYNNDDGNGDKLGQLLDTEVVHVLPKAVPSAVTSGEVITSSTITVNIDILDTDVVITGNREAILYKDGIATGSPIELFTGPNPGIQFTGLNSESVYDIKVEVDYNLTDGVTVVTDAVLLTETNTTVSNTEPTAVFTALGSTNSTITFGVTITDVDSVMTTNIKAVLYKDGIATGDEIVLVENANTGKEFTNLESNATYLINIQTDYNLLDGAGETSSYVMVNNDTSTFAKDVPIAEIKNGVVTDSTYTFDVIVTDDDLVVNIVGDTLIAVLYENGVTVISQIILNRGDNIGESFTGLYSNRLYEVRILTEYDLNDGIGAEVDYELASTSSTTLSKGTPNAIITNQVITNTVITMDVEVIDASSAIQGIATAVLYKDGIEEDSVNLVVGPNSPVEFTGLDYGADYVINIETDYNNNIGDPDVTDFVMTQDLQSTKQLIYLEGITLEALSVYFDVVSNDEFSILYDDNIELIIYDQYDQQVGNSFVLNLNTPSNSATVDLVNYFNNQSYRVEVKANVKDGGGGYTTDLVFESSLVVPPKNVQSISLTEVIVTGTDVNTTVTMDISDADNKLITGNVKVVLFELQGGVYVSIDSVVVPDNDLLVVTFTINATTGGEYMVGVTADVDFNEQGLGVIANYLLEQRSFVYTLQTPAP